MRVVATLLIGTAMLGVTIPGIAAAPIAAQDAPAEAVRPAIITSAGPEAVSVSIYRAPYRGEDDDINTDRPDGYALVSETRTITLPAGRAVIRFEGVAGNIFAETAIVSGLPDDVREKNLDADLLSPRTLYDRALGRQVIIRRTDKATGAVREEQATIRSGAGGAAVIQTAGGSIDTLGCSGLPETIVYPDIPDGLSAKPTLSIQTDSATERTVTITLSYLAGGFDWQADYVVQMRDDGKADLFGWLTLASSDITSFEGAGAQVIAGKPNREADYSQFGDYRGGMLELNCWPLPQYAGGRRPSFALPPPPPPPPPPPAMAAPMMAMESAIVVTGSSRKAVQEELGDLKLYRIPDKVTVASKAQKQVALFDKLGVALKPVYVSEHYEASNGNPELILRVRNKPADGLGLPLPAGKVAVFQPTDIGASGIRPLLVGESSIADKAINEEVEIKLGDRPMVNSRIETLSNAKGVSRHRLTVTNANPFPISYEATFGLNDGVKMSPAGARLGRKDGAPFWVVTVPANGNVILNYDLKRPKR